MSHSYAWTAAIVLAAMAMLAPAAAQADEMAFFMKNQTGRAVAVELRSRDRDQVWPGGDKVYLLDKGAAKSVPVSCNAGEKSATAPGSPATTASPGASGLTTTTPAATAATSARAKRRPQVRIGP